MSAVATGARHKNQDRSLIRFGRGFLFSGFIVSVFPFRNRVSPNKAFEGLELGEGKTSRPVLRGPGGRKATPLLGSNSSRPDSPHYSRFAPLLSR
jgi:hypothetical protein